MKRIIAVILALSVCLVFCACDNAGASVGEKLSEPEKLISMDKTDAVTLEISFGEDTTHLAYKKTDDGFVFYEKTADGTENICVTEGDESASFVRGAGQSVFVYTEIDYESIGWFESDVEYYLYNFACYGFDYEEELGKAEFVKRENEKIDGRDCYVYDAEVEGSSVTLSVDVETGLWLKWAEASGEAVIKSFSFDAEVIPEYK